MFRKTLLAVSALAVIGAASLAPTAASAGGGGWKHHHHNKHHGWGHGHGYGYGVSYVGYNNCWTKRWIDTPFGPRLKRVYVCY